jgi:hypothetical protein
MRAATPVSVSTGAAEPRGTETPDQPRRRLRAVLVGAAVLAIAGSLTAGGAADAQSEAPPIRVTVNTRAGLATMPATGIGINHAIWDSELGTNTVSGLLKAAGVQAMRYPGGSYGDIYHWYNHTAPGGFVAPNTDFDTFMAGVQRAGSQAIIIANYGTGTPQEAADWVRYANITQGYGVKYWEIGNELYGNGHYGAEWEADDHPDKSPAFYAGEVVAYAQAMKAVDPTIQIGAVLTTPASWPAGVGGAAAAGTWNQVVLSIAGPHIDFAAIHWYPGGANAADALTKSVQIDDFIYLIRRQIAQHAGPNAANIRIALTEMNVGVGKNTQPGALFAAETYATLLASGVFMVNWWDVHNGPTASSTIAGHTDYDDWGILSSGTCLANGVCEPAINTPFAAYYALQMLGLFARPGDQLLRAEARDAIISAHAARRPNGDLALLLINKDPDRSHAVAVDYAGFSPAAGAPTVHTFANGDTAIATSQTGTAREQVLPPYSLTTLVLRPTARVVRLPQAPGQPVASAVTDRTATISWRAAVPGDHPIAKYEVYRHRGATSEQLGETPGTSFTVANLEPGQRYVINVLTRDTAGNVSWSSPPVTVTTTAPAQSTCAVRLTDVNNWGSGFVASVDLVNTGPHAINGWTLTFSWPTSWQRMDGGWNGTWVQSGQRVTVSNADFNRDLTPNGGAANIGFVGGYNGPNVMPGVFALNGTICSSL